MNRYTFPADLLTAALARMNRDFAGTVRVGVSGLFIDDSLHFVAMLAVELCREIVENTSDDYETGDTDERNRQLDMVTNLIDSACAYDSASGPVTHFRRWTLSD